MLDDRKAAILRAVVEEYIETAQPVGSTHVADAPGVRVSSATVRNDMAVLEQEGYLVQPHTSAGRVPTDKGYRFFVDHLAQPGRLDSVGYQFGMVSLGPQINLQAESDAGLVFHHEDAFHGRLSAGSKIVNVLPFPGSLSSKILPP